jgi:hypothetical protein
MAAALRQGPDERLRLAAGGADEHTLPGAQELDGLCRAPSLFKILVRPIAWSHAVSLCFKWTYSLKKNKDRRAGCKGEQLIKSFFP